MRNYKRFAVATAAVLLTTMLWACGEDEEKKKNNSESDTVAVTAEEVTSTEAKTTEEKTTKEETTTEVAKIKVKDIVGKSSENAETILKSQGFEVFIESEFSNDVEEGYVISQSPSADNNLSLEKGDVITIVVSKGKEPVEAEYLDSIVYAGYVSGSPYAKMSAYEGTDNNGNTFTRAIKFECNNTQSKQNDEALE